MPGEPPPSGGHVRRFDGEGEDAPNRYYKWKKWARAYLKTQKARGTTDEALGSILFCLLDGTAENALEGLDIDDLDVPGGEDLIFDILDMRFPEPEAQDKIGDALDDVFRLRVERNEKTAVYTGRCAEVFDRAAREGVDLPVLARGYLMLRGAKLSPERKAIVLAASRRSYLAPDVASALRTTFPTNLASGRDYVNVAEDDDLDAPGPAGPPSPVGDDDAEIEALVGESAPEPPPIAEKEAIDILVTYKETRRNISKEKLARGFGPPRPDLATLKKRVRCFKCQQLGHFSKDCTADGPPSQSSRSAPGSRHASARFVGASPAFVCSVLMDMTEDEWMSEVDDILAGEVERFILSIQESAAPLEALAEEMDKLHRQRTTFGPQTGSEDESEDEEVQGIIDEFHALTTASRSACLLSHSAGSGIVDTGCGRGVIGQETLVKHMGPLASLGEKPRWVPNPEQIVFTYGNGTKDRSLGVVELPAYLGGKRFLMRLHVVPGKVPLLVSKSMLKAAGARLDLTDNSIELRSLGVTVPLIEGDNGHYELNLLDSSACDTSIPGNLDGATIFVAQGLSEFEVPEETHDASQGFL